MPIKFNPYLSFKGNCELAFCFYKTVFGSEFSKLERYNEMQKEAGVPAPPEEFGYQIRHVELPVGNGVTLMGSDSVSTAKDGFSAGDNVKICIVSDDEDECRRIFEALSAGGVVKVPFSKSFWGSLYGSLIDKFGVHWIVDSHSAKTQPAFEDNANIHIP